MSNTPELIDGKLFLTIEETARYLSLGRTHVYALLPSGALKRVHIDKNHRIPADTIVDYVRSLSSEGE
jgi:excisionase family DNA binding protein